MTARRLKVLIDQLPNDSRTKARIDGDISNNRWDAGAHLAASMLELLQLIRSEALGIAGVKKPPKFKAIDRPGGKILRDMEKAAEEQAKKALGGTRVRPKKLSKDEAAQMLASLGITPPEEGGDGGRRS